MAGTVPAVLSFPPVVHRLPPPSPLEETLVAVREFASSPRSSLTLCASARSGLCPQPQSPLSGSPGLTGQLKEYLFLFVKEGRCIVLMFPRCVWGLCRLWTARLSLILTLVLLGRPPQLQTDNTC